MTLAVDFNMVLHDQLHPVAGRRMGPPMRNAKQSMEALKSQGHTLIVFTDVAVTERGIKTVKDWLEYYEIPFDEVTVIKPTCDLFIDDKALKFENWAQVMRDIEGAH